MAVKHTPGPWKSVNHGTHHLVYAKEYKNPIVLVHSYRTGVGPQRDERAENARLIAAAPDLLEAGIRVLNYATLDEIIADENRDNNDVFGIRLGDLRVLHAAIAKATGK